MSTCRHRIVFPDSCPVCESIGELAAEDDADRSDEVWVQRGERWVEQIVYGEMA